MASVFIAGLSFRGGKWYLKVGNTFIPLSKITGPLRVAAEKSLKAAAQGARAAMLPLAIGAAAGLVGWYIGARGKEREKEARVQAEHVAESQRRRADVAEDQAAETLLEKELSDNQLERGFEIPVPATPENRRGLREAQGILDEFTNIALVGQVSAGKTSFINSCRGLFPRFKVDYHFADPEFGLGPIGNREMTQEIHKYRSTRTPNTIWWDMPGIGGSGGGWWSMKYYITFNLVLYDLIILLHSGSFGQCEATIVQQYFESIENLENPPRLLLIRSHSDENLRKIIQDEALHGGELVNRLREYNRADIQRHIIRPEQLEKLRIYITSHAALWEVITRQRSGEDPVHIDEEGLLIDLGIINRESLSATEGTPDEVEVNWLPGEEEDVEEDEGGNGHASL